MGQGFSLTRHFSNEGQLPFERVSWKKEGPFEAPSFWSSTAIEIAASRYFRRGETSVRQLIQRVVKTIRQAGEWQGYFSGPTAQIFEDELSHILIHQLASFNSPVYFNVGLFPVHGLLGSAENFVYDSAKGQVQPLTSAYLRPQASACFIQDVQDDLVSIFDLLKNEAKLFKYGSGTGTNFSRLRAKGEPLEAGGESTGLISYLEIFDKAAQAIRSGGTTRRAAKMVVLDADHPEIYEFVHWKMNEERKARVLLANGFSGGMDGDAFRMVSGQNSNNSVRLTDEFMRKALNGEKWGLRSRVSGKVIREIEAAHLWREIARAAWECADPGVQFHDTIQKWHTCSASGVIRASNPCSEFMFLDNSSCNLASLNLVRFLTDKGDFDWASLAQAVRVMLLAQEILVDYASYPTAQIAENSHRYRPLGLGYSNLGALLMRMSIPYESEAAQKWTAILTGTMNALALETSQSLAESHGAFEGWQMNRASALHVLEKHRLAWMSLGAEMPWVDKIYLNTLRRAESTGLRNAQVTLIAPTGTIGLFMDCDTLGIEPEYALIKRKHLAGGGEIQLINQSVGPALARLGYSGGQIQSIEQYLLNHGRLLGAPDFKAEHAAVFAGAMQISPSGHLKIMAAAQPFLSGAISKTVNMSATSTVEDVQKVFTEGWRLGLKAIAIYRDGSKSVQPLCAEC